MGAYINPPNMTKEEWLEEHGLPLKPGVEPSSYKQGETLAVCLVDNGMFTAAGIAFSEDELVAFMRPGDPRPKTWYYVPEDKLHEVSDNLKRYQEINESRGT